MITLEQTADGILLPVKAQPGARKNSVLGIHNGQLKVAVTQVPERGKANDALVNVLTDALRLKRSQISLASGATSGRKTFLIHGLTADELLARIAAIIEP